MMNGDQLGSRVRQILIAVGCTVGGCIVVIGCQESQSPTLAGGKPIQHWVEALGDHDVKVRREAVVKLGNVGTADAAVIPALIGALKDKNAQVRCGAILALSKSGPAAQDAVGPLTEMRQHDRDPKVRDYAAKGLKRLHGGGEEASSS